MMQRILLLLFFLTIAGNAAAQSSSATPMSDEENRKWLEHVKHREKHQQIRLIRQRFFEPPGDTGAPQKQCTPGIIIDGIFFDITESTPEHAKTQFFDLLTPESIETITTIENPGSLYVNKAFCGLILFNLNDRRTFKKLKKIDLH